MQKNADGEYDTWSSDRIKRDDDVFILEKKDNKKNIKKDAKDAIKRIKGR